MGEMEKNRLLPPLNGEGLIVPVVLRSDHVNIGINPSLGGSARAANRFPDLLSQGFLRRWRTKTRRWRRRGVVVVVGRREGGGGGSNPTEEEED